MLRPALPTAGVTGGRGAAAPLTTLSEHFYGKTGPEMRERLGEITRDMVRSWADEPDGRAASTTAHSRGNMLTTNPCTHLAIGCEGKEAGGAGPHRAEVGKPPGDEPAACSGGAGHRRCSQEEGRERGQQERWRRPGRQCSISAGWDRRGKCPGQTRRPRRHSHEDCQRQQLDEGRRRWDSAGSERGAQRGCCCGAGPRRGQGRRSFRDRTVHRRRQAQSGAAPGRRSPPRGKGGLCSSERQCRGSSGRCGGGEGRR